MLLVLSGEGNSDIGKLSHSLEEFIPASMYYLIDKIIEQKLQYSFYELFHKSIIFIPKKRLLEKSKEFKSFAGKKKGKETALFYKNARALAQIAQNKSIELKDDARSWLLNSSSGDLRAMLGLLESAAVIENPVTLNTLKTIRPQAIRAGSSEADSHYELASAMIKSVRGSDIDAGLYYLARLIEGGEAPEFLARRLAILAAEDIGNANPHALNLAASTLTIVQNIGYPEARIPLSQLLIYLASSPKSNAAYNAINAAQKAVKSGDIMNVPEHIKTHAKDYLYPHSYGGWVKQQYLPSPRRFYKSSNIGYEKTLSEWLNKIKQK